MGYYTKYNVTISKLDDENQGAKIADMLDMTYYNFSDDGTTLYFDYDGKWYDWKEDCIRVSLQYPKILIEVEGEGEENGDMWKARVRNGVCERIEAKIVFDDFKVIT